eukprot:15028822-Alexandrium_andersonii.AAC.1
MSASLVGSEMCIRDRVLYDWKVSASAHSLISGRGALAKPVSRARKQSVSYTHLTLPTICSV